MTIQEIAQAVFGKEGLAPVKDIHILWQIIENMGATHQYKVEIVLENTDYCKIYSIN